MKTLEVTSLIDSAQQQGIDFPAFCVQNPDVTISMERWRRRLAVNNPKCEQLDQAVSDALPYDAWIMTESGNPDVYASELKFRQDLHREEAQTFTSSPSPLNSLDAALAVVSGVSLIIPDSSSAPLQDEFRRCASEAHARESRLRVRNRTLAMSNRLLRADTFTRDVVQETMQNTLDRLPILAKHYLPWKIDFEESNQEGTFLLALHDIHCGQLLGRGESGGLGAYDLEIFKARAKSLLKQAMSAIAPKVRAGHCKKIVILLGGDMIDGRDIHPGHAIASAPLDAQLQWGPEVIANIIAQLAVLPVTINVLYTVGNHGRAGKKGEMDKVHDNFDKVFMDILSLRCASLSNVHFVHNDTWFTYFKIYDHKVFAEHGDEIRGNLGSPWGTVAKRREMMAMLVKGDIDLYMMGHIHTPTVIQSGYGYSVINGSWPGTGAYSIGLGKGCLPIQKLLWITPDSPLSACYDLRMETHQQFLTTEALTLC